LVVGFVF